MSSPSKLQLPVKLSKAIEEEIRSSGLTPKQIASDILALSDHYQTEDSMTPWQDKKTVLAYISYFLPLNLIRIMAVAGEAQRLNFFADLERIIDFGAGPGTSHFALDHLKLPMMFIECAPEARTVFEHLSDSIRDSAADLKWLTKIKTSKLKRGSLLVCSYSLNELDQTPEWLTQPTHLMLLEPSTQTAGRRLQETRQHLVDNGFYIWAPCLHQKPCPLLTQSKKDWCHHSVDLKMPEWFEEISEHLPMKNESLTYSYLLASRRTPPEAKENQFRIIGDMLKEKGKSRVLACRNEEREFISWLKKNHPSPPDVKRGQLLEIDAFEKKGNEIRPDN